MADGKYRLGIQSHSVYVMLEDIREALCWGDLISQDVIDSKVNSGHV